MDKPEKRLQLTGEQLDGQAEQQYLEYLDSIGAIHADGTIDRSKIKYHSAQTFEELEALLWADDDHTDG